MSADSLTRRPARGATALRGGRVWWPSPYQVVGFGFFLVMTLACWRVPLCCDAGQHAAVIERLKANLLDPRHPTADLPGAGSPYYSPYALAQGVFARLTGLTGWEVLRLAAPVNLLVLLTGVGRFTRVLTPRPWAPVLALAAMTLLWGTDRAWWSGYLGLMSMTGTLPYPSAFAAGLTFWAWALTGARARDDRRVRFVGPRGMRGFTGYAALGALYGLILLVHPITAVAAFLGGTAFVLGWERGWRSGALARWATAGVVTVAVAAGWPYFDVFALAGDTGVDGMHKRLYGDLWGHFWLALLGVPALSARARRSARDPLVLLFVLECAVVAYGWVSGHYTYGRVLGLTLVPLQFALAVDLAAPRPWGPGRRVLAGCAAAAACLGLWTVHAGAVVPRALDPVGFDQPPDWPSYDWAARHIPAGEVVVTDGYHAVHAIAGYGANLAAPAWPDASVAEGVRAARLADVRAYLSPAASPAERASVGRRYRVRWLLLTRWHRVPEEAVVVAWSRRTGEVLARVRY
ncbi:hypothetical protein [Streptomyces sp. 4F14]|uniref:hypothetical protein n=1 Tax=Streptomyces sp. 4F14 TaxID=3394380 RepID=UPI003A8A3167